jgi:hypothetical protein
MRQIQSCAKQRDILIIHLAALEDCQNGFTRKDLIPHVFKVFVKAFPGKRSSGIISVGQNVVAAPRVEIHGPRFIGVNVNVWWEIVQLRHRFRIVPLE